MPFTVNVKLKPRASKCTVKIIGKRSLEVSVTAPPVNNMANERLIEVLAKSLHVCKSSLTIIKGLHCKNKTVEICGFAEDADLELSFSDYLRNP